MTREREALRHRIEKIRAEKSESREYEEASEIRKESSSLRHIKAALLVPKRRYRYAHIWPYLCARYRQRALAFFDLPDVLISRGQCR